MKTHSSPRMKSLTENLKVVMLVVMLFALAGYIVALVRNEFELEVGLALTVIMLKIFMDDI